MHEDMDLAKGELHRHFSKVEHHNHKEGNNMDSLASLAAGAALGGNRDHGYGSGLGAGVGGFVGAALGRNGGLLWKRRTQHGLGMMLSTLRSRIQTQQ